MTLISLGDALSLIIDHRGKTPKKLGGDWSQFGHRVVSALNIKDSQVNSNDHHYIDEALYRRWMQNPLHKGDVLLTSEAPLGEVAFIDKEVDWALGQRLFALRSKPDLLDGRYLFYLFKGGEPRHELFSRATGTTVSGIRQAELIQIELDLPSLPEQRAIAAVLAALDDKIASNRRAVGILEEIRILEFHRLSTREGFAHAPLSSLATTTKGVSYKSVDLLLSLTSLVTLKSFDRKGGYKPNGLKPYVGRYKPSQVIEPGELVVALTDLTQGAEVVGRAVRVPADQSTEVLVASLDLSIVRPKTGVFYEYLYGILTSDDFRQHCRSRTSGTTVLHLASDAIPAYVAPVVPRNIQARYAEMVRPIIARTDALEREVLKLDALRDLLLPSLLSGRMHVPEAHWATR